MSEHEYVVCQISAAGPIYDRWAIFDNKVVPVIDPIGCHTYDTQAEAEAEVGRLNVNEAAGVWECPTCHCRVETS
jgi:hypothetical protein